MGGYDELLSDERMSFLTQSRLASTNVWSDAFLAAFALAADLEVVTFDRDFAQFEGLRHSILR